MPGRRGDVPPGRRGRAPRCLWEEGERGGGGWTGWPDYTCTRRTDSPAGSDRRAMKAERKGSLRARTPAASFPLPANPSCHSKSSSEISSVPLRPSHPTHPVPPTNLNPCTPSLPPTHPPVPPTHHPPPGRPAAHPPSHPPIHQAPPPQGIPCSPPSTSKPPAPTHCHHPPCRPPCQPSAAVRPPPAAGHVPVFRAHDAAAHLRRGWRGKGNTGP